MDVDFQAGKIRVVTCAQVVYMQQTLQDFNCFLEKYIIYCDNTSVMNLSKNPVNHSRTKHIDVRHHFLRDCLEKGLINLEFIKTENQIADIFTKPLNENSFIKLRRDLGIMSLKDL